MIKAIWTALGIVSVLMIFVGFYLALQNFGKDQTAFVTFLIIHLVGWVGLSAQAVVIMIKKKNKK